MTLTLFGETSGAAFSTDRRYRYRLWRVWGDPSRRVVFVGINPSDADEHDNDQTISKGIGFGQRWGFGALDMINPFALVSTDQRGLIDVDDPIGPENDQYVATVLARASRVVWAWGGGKTAAVTRLLQARLASPAWAELVRSATCEHGCLGRTNDGQPRHPLMLPYATAFEVSA